MKIAFIVSSFPTLSETFILNQITGLIDRGHEVHIYSTGPREEPKTHPDIEEYNLLERTYYRPDMPTNKFYRVLKGIWLILTNFHKKPLAIIRSLNILKYGKKALSLQLLYDIIPFIHNQESYDVIHCQFGTNGNKAVRLRKLGLLESNMVTSFHGYDVRLGLEKGGGIYEELFNHGVIFFAGTEYNYEKFIEFGLEENKIIRHPVGIDLERFPFKWESQPNEGLEEIRIITVGRLEEVKGLKYGIKAFSRLKNQNKELDLRYEIVGGGSLYTELNNLTKELGIQDSVTLTGAMDRDEVQEELQKHHIFILPSIAESFGVVLLEAQAVGLPVIASDVGSVDQAITTDKSGFLVPAKDVDALAKKLQYLVDHPEDWPKMGRAGREYVEENYDINKLNDQLVKIYQKVTDGRLP